MAAVKKGISFPALQSWNPMTKFATIAAQVDGRRVLCRVSSQDLRNRFNAAADAPMDAVTRNRSVLEGAARRLIEKGSFEKDGSILIRYEDL